MVDTAPQYNKCIGDETVEIDLLLVGTVHWGRV